MIEELTIETELEQESERWIAEVIELPGVLVYGSSESEAINIAKALALRVLAERLEHDEPAPGIGKLFCLKPMSSTTEALSSSLGVNFND